MRVTAASTLKSPAIRDWARADSKTVLRMTIKAKAPTSPTWREQRCAVSQLSLTRRNFQLDMVPWGNPREAAIKPESSTATGLEPPPRAYDNNSFSENLGYRWLNFS